MREMTEHHSRHISDAFRERHQKLLPEVDEGADSEDPDEHRSKEVLGRVNENVFTQFATDPDEQQTHGDRSQRSSADRR